MNIKVRDIMTISCYNPRMDSEFYEVVLPFGQALKLRRDGEGLTQKVLAARAGMKQNTLSGWEHLIKAPKDDEAIERLAQELGCSAKDLREGRIELSRHSGKSAREWEAAIKFATDMLDYVSLGSFPIVLEFVKELAKVSYEQQEDIWRFVRQMMRGHIELVEKDRARVLGTPPKQDEEYETELKKESV